MTHSTKICLGFSFMVSAMFYYLIFVLKWLIHLLKVERWC
jgi:hypothetical protein